MHEDLKKALNTLFNGGIILYPTNYSWGLGCDSTNPNAIEKLRQITASLNSNSAHIIVDIAARISSYVSEVPDVAWDLIEYAEKPLILIFSNIKNLADNLTYKNGSLGIEVNTDEFCVKLVQRFKKPIVFNAIPGKGNSNCTSFSEIDDNVKSQVDCIINRKLEDTLHFQPPSIIKLGSGGLIDIIRQ